MHERKVFTYDTQQSQFCCGLEEVGEFRMDDPLYYDDPKDQEFENLRDIAQFATTTRSQTAAIKRLRAAGFKHIESWTRENGKTLWLWFKKPVRPRKTRKKVQRARVRG